VSQVAPEYELFSKKLLAAAGVPPPLPPSSGSGRQSGAAAPADAGAPPPPTTVVTSVRAAGLPPAAVIPPGEDDEPPSEGGQPNFSGTWKVVKNENYAAYLDALRVRPLVKLAALRAPTWQIIEHAGADFAVTSKSVVTFRTRYVIDGPASTQTTAGHVTEDTLAWNGDALVLTKKCVSKGYVLTAERRMVSSSRPGVAPQYFTFRQHVTALDGKKPDVDAVSVLQRVG